MQEFHFPLLSRFPHLLGSNTHVLKSTTTVSVVFSVSCLHWPAHEDGNITVSAERFRCLEVCGYVFGHLVREHLCFDFVGNGRLNLNESDELVNFELISYSKRMGFPDTVVDVPFKSSRDYNRMLRLFGHGSQEHVKLVVGSTKK